MAHYLAPDASLHCIDARFANLLPPGSVEISAADAKVIEAPVETPEQIAARLTAAVQRHLDATAAADGWDNIYTASLRASYPGPWQAKGIAYATWMDACWVACHQVQDAVAAGSRPIPAEAELIAELPAPVLP